MLIYEENDYIMDYAQKTLVTTYKHPSIVTVIFAQAKVTCIL